MYNCFIFLTIVDLNEYLDLMSDVDHQFEMADNDEQLGKNLGFSFFE
jgi:hypothetical protein